MFCKIIYYFNIYRKTRWYLIWYWNNLLKKTGQIVWQCKWRHRIAPTMYVSIVVYCYQSFHRCYRFIAAHKQVKITKLFSFLIDLRFLIWIRKTTIIMSITLCKFNRMMKGGVLTIYEVKHDHLWSELLWNKNISGFMHVKTPVRTYDDVILPAVMEYGVSEV